MTEELSSDVYIPLVARRHGTINNTCAAVVGDGGSSLHTGHNDRLQQSTFVATVPFLGCPRTGYDRTAARCYHHGTTR